MKLIIFLFFAFSLLMSCGKQQQNDSQVNTNSVQAAQHDSVKAKSESNLQKPDAQRNTGGAIVTFIELGSVNCIPCKKMQPIMKSIEQKYGEQVKVIFYDVNKEPDRAGEYKIQLIPTQVFLDKNGKEIHRHEGYYPEKEIDKLLQSHGLKVKA